MKPEWLSSVDFIYSNSFDHSFDPEKCLSAWMSCLKPGGVCLLEHTDAHGPRSANELDPFGAELAIMPYLIATWGVGRFAVTDILKAPSGSSTFSYASETYQLWQQTTRRPTVLAPTIDHAAYAEVFTRWG